MLTNLSSQHDKSTRKPNTFYLFFRKQSKMTKLLILTALLALAGSVYSFSMTMSTPSSSPTSDRRSFVRNAGTAGAAAAIIAPTSARAVLADPTATVDTSDFIEAESGLKYKVLKEGTGAIPAQGQTVKVSTFQIKIEISISPRPLSSVLVDLNELCITCRTKHIQLLH